MKLKFLTNLHLTDSHGQSIFSASRVKLMETLAHHVFLTIRVPLIRPSGGHFCSHHWVYVYQE